MEVDGVLVAVMASSQILSSNSLRENARPGWWAKSSEILNGLLT